MIFDNEQNVVDGLLDFSCKSIQFFIKNIAELVRHVILMETCAYSIPSPRQALEQAVRGKEVFSTYLQVDPR
jgi:hypothetical protein